MIILFSEDDNHIDDTTVSVFISKLNHVPMLISLRVVEYLYTKYRHYQPNYYTTKNPTPISRYAVNRWLWHTHSLPKTCHSHTIIFICRPRPKSHSNVFAGLTALEPSVLSLVTIPTSVVPAATMSATAPFSGGRECAAYQAFTVGYNIIFGLHPRLRGCCWVEMNRVFI